MDDSLFPRTKCSFCPPIYETVHPYTLKSREMKEQSIHKKSGGWTCTRGFKICCDGCYTHEHTHTHLPLSLIALLFVCVLLPLFGTPYQKCHFRSCCSSSSSSLSSYGKSSYLSFLVLPSLLPSLFVLSVAPNCGYIALGQLLFKSCICH